MAVLRDVAEEVGAHERTLRRGLSEGLVHGRRPTPRTVELAQGEIAYLRANWPLLDTLRRTLRTERSVRLAILIGSAARGTLRQTSDVDVLVQLTTVDWRTRAALRTRLERATGRTVDLVSFEAAMANPTLLNAALHEGRVLIDRDGRWSATRAQGPQLANAALQTRITQRAELHRLLSELSEEN